MKIVDTNRTWRCPSPLGFFGLTPKYMEQVYEQFHSLKYYGGWSLFEAYNLPVQLRVWFAKRLVEQMEMEAEASKGRK